MKVSDILRVKGHSLITVTPDESLASAVQIMSEKDIGSLVVMEHGDLVGMLTFREVMQSLAKNAGSIGNLSVRKSMDDAPITCTSETDMDEVRRMMLNNHARYMPEPCALHARHGQSHAHGCDQFLRCGQGRGRQPEF
ncbi:MAG: hypothetical protein RIS72_1056 [Pseudomonadota bacterium]